MTSHLAEQTDTRREFRILDPVAEMVHAPKIFLVLIMITSKHSDDIIE